MKQCKCDDGYVPSPEDPDEYIVKCTNCLGTNVIDVPDINRLQAKDILELKFSEKENLCVREVIQKPIVSDRGTRIERGGPDS